MFRKILDAIRRGLVKIGLLKSIENLVEHKDVSVNREMFDHIEKWKALYKGFHEDIHEVTYHTIKHGLQKRRIMTMNMPKAAAQEMASLVFNEKCEISIDDDTVAEFIEDVFDNNKFDKKFQDFIEYMFAHGGMVIKPYVENEQILLSFVTADCFIPISWKNDTIYEAVFPFEFKKRDKKYTHLEWHLWEDGIDEKGSPIKLYVIKNEVYESQNGTDLGIKVPLKDHFPNLEEVVRLKHIKRPIFAYFKPNTANNIDTNSPLGVSLYANALDTLKAIDTAFDSFHREFRLGKKRILVPAHMIKSVVDPETGQLHRYFDESDETYEAFDNGNMDESKIQDITVELRVDEHIAAINALLNLFAMQTGFSTGTFSFDGKSMKTATEVVSEQSKTFKSKQSHEVIIESALQELIQSIVAMGELYNMISAPDEYEITVTFDDSIAEDKSTDIKQQIQLVTSGLQSHKRAIMKIHGVTEEEALKIMKEIEQEQLESDPMFLDDRRQQRLFGAVE